jgi:hypothetical protein
MNVNETGRDHLAARIDNLDILFILGKRIDDAAIPYKEISDSVNPIGRINDSAPLDVQ